MVATNDRTPSSVQAEPSEWISAARDPLGRFTSVLFRSDDDDDDDGGFLLSL
jgi:hypothetical protein